MQAVEEAIVVERPSTAALPRQQWWQPAVLLALLLLVYAPVVRDLIADWNRDANFSHGFVVPLFVAFVVWRERKSLAALSPRPSWWGLPLVVIACITTVLGFVGAEMFLPRFSLILLMAGLLIQFAGWQWFRALLFPWATLFLMVPIPAIIFNQITFPLQLFASRVASVGLPLLGVPVLRSGNVIELPAMPLEVAEACSGIRSLVTLITLAVIYGYLLEKRTTPRWLLVIAAVPIAVAANALRVIGTGLLVQYWDADKALGFFHEFSGWLMFLISTVMLLGVQSMLRLIFNRRAEAH